MTRSLFGGTLPLAGPIMYHNLSPQWAGTLLGLLEVLLIPIPFAFYRYGEKIRSKSRVISQMREDYLKNEGKRARQQQRAQRRREREETVQEGVLEKEVAVANSKSPNVEETVDLERNTGGVQRIKDETAP